MVLSAKESTTSSDRELVASPDSSRTIVRDHRTGPFSNQRYRLTDVQAIVGLTCVILGSLALGFETIGYVNGHEIIPILITSGVGLFVTAMWYGVSRQYQYAWIFGGLAGFNATYVLLQLGIWHSWYGIPNNAIPRMTSVYLGIWVLLFAFAAYAMLRDSKGLAAILAAVDVGLIIAIVAVIKDSTTIFRWASIPVFSIALLSSYSVLGIIRSWRKRRASRLEILADGSSQGIGAPGPPSALNAAGRSDLPSDQVRRESARHLFSR